MDQDSDSNTSFIGLTEAGMQRKLDEIETKITGGYKVLTDDPGDKTFKPKRDQPDFNQAHIVKVKDLESREQLLASKEKQF